MAVETLNLSPLGSTRTRPLRLPVLFRAIRIASYNSRRDRILVALELERMKAESRRHQDPHWLDDLAHTAASTFLASH